MYNSACGGKPIQTSAHHDNDFVVQTAAWREEQHLAASLNAGVLDRDNNHSMSVLSADGEMLGSFSCSNL